MVELSEAQVELVSAYIKQNGVAQDELHDDLLDHVCTSMEQRMQQGESFGEAFQYTLSLFGPGGLKQVQNETFELLTEMNATMKKVTFGFGLTSTFLLLAGTIFKLNHWPLASILIFSGAVLLVLGYLPMILAHKLKESPKDERMLHIAGFLGLSLTAVGVLFKIMHWPGAAVILYSGMGILAFGYVPIYFFKRYKVSANRSITLSSSIVATACLILIFALARTGNSVWYEAGIMQTDEQLRESALLASNLNASLYNENMFSGSEQLRAETDALVNHIEQVKLNLIATAEKTSLEAAKNIDLRSMGTKHKMNVSTEVLLGFDDNPASGPYSGEELKKELDAFRDLILQQYPTSMQATLDETLPLNTSKTYTNRIGEQQDWLHHHFETVPLFTVISKLSEWQLEARQMETAVLMYHISRPEVSNPPS